MAIFFGTFDPIMILDKGITLSQCVNFSRSTALFSPCLHPKFRRLLISGALDLGTPLWFGRKKNADFHYLLDRVRAKIQGWESNLLLSIVSE